MRKSFIIYLGVCCVLLTACNSSNVRATNNIRTEVSGTIREDLANSIKSNLSTASDVESKDLEKSITSGDTTHIVGDFASFDTDTGFCEAEDNYYSSLMEEVSNDAIYVAEFAHLHEEDESIGKIEKLYDDADKCYGDSMLLVQLVDIEKIKELKEFNLSVPLSNEELDYFVNQLKERYTNVAIEDVTNDSGKWCIITADGISGKESSVEQLTVAAIGYLNDEKTIAAIQLTNINNEDTMMSLDERRSFISQEAKTITDSFILN